MKPQRTMSAATIARKAREGAQRETDPARRAALLAIAEGAQVINGANQEYIAKAVLRAQSTSIIHDTMREAIAAGRVNPARWCAEVLAERGVML